MAYMVVTGASSGIGAAISFELARRNYDLIIIARDLRLLTQLKQQLSATYQIDVVMISFDLTQIEKLKELHRTCLAYEVIGLVNNAGCGLYGSFTNLNFEAQLNLIALNVTSVQLLSYLFLSDFIKQGEGYLLNVASTAAFQAGPMMASYYASKAYVLNLTEAIAEELKDHHPQVKISVLCPGPVATPFHEKMAIKAVSKRIPSAEKVAEYAVKHWLSGKVLIIPQFPNRLLVFLNRFLPRRLGRYFVKKNQLKKQI